MKNNDTIWNRTSDFLICRTATKPLRNSSSPPLEIYIEVVSIVKLYINIAHYVSYISYNLQLNHSNTEVHRNTNKPAQH